MSGVYIKGLEMPTNCFDCKLRIAVGCYGNLPHNTRMPNCPVFPVSEGRMNYEELKAEAERQGIHIDVIDAVYQARDRKP